ncbi:probable cytochrome P450 4e1 [Drosophila tropicalis]|uniref:probable cytochrome P450 4e1 n=1 Tax=Drosophila tropicalis TaxID=46794 RepID=UPI0035ABAB6F
MFMLPYPIVGFVLGLVLVCVVLYRRRYERIIRHIDKGFVGPKVHPLFGNVLQLGFTPDAYLRSIFGWLEQFNYKNFRVWVGPLPYIAFVEPKYVEHILSSTQLGYKNDPYHLLYPWLGKGLLTANDHEWMLRRKMITPSFHFRILRDFLHVMNETSGRFMELLAVESKKSKDQVLDMQSYVTRSTIDVICETAMGTRVNSIEGQPSIIVKAIDTLCYVAPERLLSVMKRPDILFKCTRLYRQQELALATLRKELAQLIEQRRAIVKSPSYINVEKVGQDEQLEVGRPKMAFLDNLLTAEVEGKPLTFQQIFEEVSTFMFEGHDTTASAITFAVYCLAWTPAAQQRAYEEQQQIYGSAKDTHPTFQELQDMKYLDLVIKETLRIFPSVPFIFRSVRKGTVIVDKFVPKGTTIVLPLVATGHSPHCFKNPHEFQPERFEMTDRNQASAFDHVPFSAGPRNCIGQKFALMELKVTLSKLLRRFRILPAPLAKQTIADVFHPKYKPGEQELKLYLPITLKSLSGVPVRLEERI